MREIVVGTRNSPLALAQTNIVLEAVKKHRAQSFTIKEMVTEGDRKLDVSLDRLAGRGIFNQELDEALIAKEIDVAVHSMKDLPIKGPEALVTAAIPVREDPREALISSKGLSLRELPEGAVVGTSSLRRTAQLKALRPDIQTKKIRGPIDQRIDQLKRGDYDAIILAVAGLNRLGLEHYITEYLPTESFLPAASQGALIIQCRKDDDYTREVFKTIHDPATSLATEAERLLVARLDPEEKAPLACLAEVEGSVVTLTGMVLNEEGTKVIKDEATGNSAEEVAEALAERLLSQGAGEMIERYASR